MENAAQKRLSNIEIAQAARLRPIREIAAGLADDGDLHRLLVRFLEPIVRLAGAQAHQVP